MRAQLTDGLLSPSSLDNPAQRQKLDALIERVRQHPALYDYFLTDKPGAAQFPALGKLVAHLRERDPAHLAYINLFPTYIYTCANHTGGIANPDGTPTPIYHALKSYNREFVAIARELQPLRSLGVHHTSMKEPGCEPLPATAAFRLDQTAQGDKARGFLLGSFGPKAKPTHVVVVNLDHKSEATATLAGSGQFEAFDAAAGKWTETGKAKAELRLPPGGGSLLRVR